MCNTDDSPTIITQHYHNTQHRLHKHKSYKYTLKDEMLQVLYYNVIIKVVAKMIVMIYYLMQLL